MRMFILVYPKRKVGNLMDDSLQEIWTKSEILSNLRKHDIGACGKCKYNFVCGGCRAYSGLYEKDAMCPKGFYGNLYYKIVNGDLMIYVKFFLKESKQMKI